MLHNSFGQYSQGVIGKSHCRAVVHACYSRSASAHAAVIFYSVCGTQVRRRRRRRAFVSRSMSSAFDALPSQVFSLFKLLSYPTAGDAHGDYMDDAFVERISPEHGRSVVDCGLHECESLVAAVKHGFIVHGFEPMPAHTPNDSEYGTVVCYEPSFKAVVETVIVPKIMSLARIESKLWVRRCPLNRAQRT